MKRLIDKIAILTACVAIVSCSKQESEPQPDTGDRVIRLSAEIASAPQSKGVSLTNEAQTGMVFLRKDDVNVIPVNLDFTDAVSFTADRAANGAFSNFSTPQLYNTNNDYVHLVGYHPAGTVNSGTTSWTLADGGKTDLILTETIWSAGRYSAPEITGMTFDHQLARLQVVCIPDPTAAISLVQSTWGQITKIEILLTANTATFNHSTRKMSFSDSTTLTLSAADCQTDLTNITLTADNTTPCAGGMFAPVDRKAFFVSLWLRVYTTTTTEGHTIDVLFYTDFAKGMTHTATLTFGALYKNIDVTTTSVEAWVEGGTGGMDDITSVPVMTLSQGVLDMRYSELIKSGSMDGKQADITSTKSSYNSSNANNNGGYKTSVSDVFAEPAYYRLEVAKANETATAGTSGWSADGKLANWTTAWDACKAKAPAGEWRLPRTSELVLMYLNKTELAKIPGFASFTPGINLSSTENNTSCWIVYFNSGYTASLSKTTAQNVRCVREL